MPAGGDVRSRLMRQAGKSAVAKGENSVGQGERSSDRAGYLLRAVPGKPW